MRKIKLIPKGLLGTVINNIFPDLYINPVYDLRRFEYFPGEINPPTHLGGRYNPINTGEVDVNPTSFLDGDVSGNPYSNSFDLELGYRPDCSGTYCYIMDNMFGTKLGLLPTLALDKDYRFYDVLRGKTNIPADLKLKRGDAMILTPRKGVKINITNGGTRKHGTPSHVLFIEGGAPKLINGVMLIPAFETTGNNVSRRVYVTFGEEAERLQAQGAFKKLDREVSIYGGHNSKNELLSIRRLKDEYRLRQKNNPELN